MKSERTRPSDTRVRHRRTRVRRVRRDQLLVQLPVAFLLLSLMSLVAVGAITNDQARRALEHTALDHLATTATLKEDEINRWLSDMQQDVELLARDPFLVEEASLLLAEEAGGTAHRAAHETLRDYLRDVQRTKDDFSEVMILRAGDGEVIFSTNPDHESSVELGSSFFIEGQQDTYIQGFYSSGTVGELTMTVATPLHISKGGANQAGEGVLGILAVHLDLARLDDIMLQRAGLGATGETYLVDSSNGFVSPVQSGGEPLATSVGIEKALRDKMDGAGIYENSSGVRVVGVYRWVDERDVALLAEMQLSEVLSPVRGLVWVTLLAIIVTGVVVAGVAYGVSRQISRPILDLARTSARMAAGDLDRAVAPGSALARRDEIGTLALAFDDMATQLRRLIEDLEERVAERTAELERRVVQLAIAADVGRAAASIPELDVFMQQVVDLVRDRFDLYYAGLFLVNRTGEQAVLEAGTGDLGRTMKKAGHKLAVGGSSMVGSACSTGEAQIALDIQAKRPEPEGTNRLVGGVRFDDPPLPETRSEMALPLIVGDRALGALDVHATREAAFSESDIAVLQLVADQVAVAVDSARKLPAEGGLMEGASPIYRLSQRLAASTTTDEVSAVVLDTVAETEADGCAVGRFDLGFDGELTGLTFLARWDRDTLDFPSARPDDPSRRAPEAPGRPRLQTPMTAGHVLPLSLMTTVTMIEDVLTDDRMPAAARSWLRAMGIRALAIVPLQLRSRPGEAPIGFMMVDRETPGPFSRVSQRLYETVADQAAVALERARLLEASQQRAWREHRIRDISDRVTASFDLQQVLRAAVEELGDLIGAAGGYVEMGPHRDVRQPLRKGSAATGDRQARGEQ